VPETLAVPGAEGAYLFWRTLDETSEAALKDLSLPTAAAHMVFPDERMQALFEGILSDGGLRRSDFRTHALRKVYFKSFLRRAVVHPENLEMGEEGPDELHPGRRRIEVSFTLPRGAYATMVVKRLMLDDE
jgi:tRNA pseudouridine13 synthase